MQNKFKTINLKIFLIIFLAFGGFFLASKTMAAEKCSEAVKKIIPDVDINTGDITFKWDYMDGASEYIITTICKGKVNVLPPVSGDKNYLTISDDNIDCAGCNYTIQAKCCLDGCTSCTASDPGLAYTYPETFCDGLFRGYPKPGKNTCFCRDKDFAWCKTNNKAVNFQYKKNKQGLTTGCFWVCGKTVTGDDKSICGIDYTIKCGNASSVLVDSYTNLISLGNLKNDLCALNDTQRTWSDSKFNIYATDLLTNKPIFPPYNLVAGKNIWQWKCSLDNGTKDADCKACRRAECGKAYGEVFNSKEEFEKTVKADGYDKWFCNAAVDNWKTADISPVLPLDSKDILAWSGISGDTISWDCIGEQACNSMLVNNSNKNFAAKKVFDDPQHWWYIYEQVDKCKATIASCGSLDGTSITEDYFFNAGTSVSGNICPVGAEIVKVAVPKYNQWNLLGVVYNYFSNLRTGIQVNKPTYAEEGWEWACKFTGENGKVVYKNCAAYKIDCQFNTSLDSNSKILDNTIIHNLTDNSYYGKTSIIPLLSDAPAQRVDYFCRNGRIELIDKNEVSLVGSPDVVYDAANKFFPGWTWQCQDTDTGSNSSMCSINKTVCAEPDRGYAERRDDIINTRPLCKNAKAVKDDNIIYKFGTNNLANKVVGYTWQCEDDLGDKVDCNASKVDCSDSVKQIMERKTSFNLAAAPDDPWKNFIDNAGSIFNGSVVKVVCSAGTAQNQYPDLRDCTGLCNDPTISVPVTFGRELLGCTSNWTWTCGKDDPFKNNLSIDPIKFNGTANKCSIVSIDHHFTPTVTITKAETPICILETGDVQAESNCDPAQETGIAPFTWSDHKIIFGTPLGGIFYNGKTFDGEIAQYKPNSLGEREIKVNALCADRCAKEPKTAFANTVVNVIPDEKPEAVINPGINYFNPACEDRAMDFLGEDKQELDQYLKCKHPSYNWYCYADDGSFNYLAINSKHLSFTPKNSGCSYDSDNKIFLELVCDNASGDECIADANKISTTSIDLDIEPAEKIPDPMAVKPEICPFDNKQIKFLVSSGFNQKLIGGKANDQCDFKWYRIDMSDPNNPEELANSYANINNSYYQFDALEKDGSNQNIWKSGHAYKLRMIWDCSNKVCIDNGGNVESNEFTISKQKEVLPSLTVKPASPICGAKLPASFTLDPDCADVTSLTWVLDDGGICTGNENFGNKLNYNIDPCNFKGSNVNAKVTASYKCLDEGRCIDNNAMIQTSTIAIIEEPKEPSVTIVGKQLICSNQTAVFNIFNQPPNNTPSLKNCPIANKNTYTWNLNGAKAFSSNVYTTGRTYTPNKYDSANLNPDNLKIGDNNIELSVNCDNICAIDNIAKDSRKLTVIQAEEAQSVTIEGELTKICDDTSNTLTAVSNSVCSGKKSYNWFRQEKSNDPWLPVAGNSELLTLGTDKIANYKVEVICTAQAPCLNEIATSTPFEVKCPKCLPLVEWPGGPYNSKGVKEVNGGWYRTIKINDICWFKDNLNNQQITLATATFGEDDKNIYLSEDDGNSWQVYVEGASDHVALYFTHNGEYLFSGSHGSSYVCTMPIFGSGKKKFICGGWGGKNKQNFDSTIDDKTAYSVALEDDGSLQATVFDGLSWKEHYGYKEVLQDKYKSKVNRIRVSDDGKNQVVVGYYNGVWRSDKYGAATTWKEIKPADDSLWQWIEADKTFEKLVILGTNTYINISEDGGKTWKEYGERREWGGVRMSDDGRKLVAFAQGKNSNPPGDYIYTSIDGGETWKNVTLGLKPKLWWGIDTSPDLSTIFAVAENSGRAYLSKDFGATWDSFLTEANWHPAALSASRFCYNNNSDNCDVYGGLYTWHQAIKAKDTSKCPAGICQGICPPGWHIPTIADFNDSDIKNQTTGGNALKRVSQDNTATDTSGFSGLLAGVRGDDGAFSKMTEEGTWWTADIIKPGNILANVFSVKKNKDNILSGYYPITAALPVRCVMDK